MVKNTQFLIQQKNMIFSGIKKKIETINGGKELFYEKTMLEWD